MAEFAAVGGGGNSVRHYVIGTWEVSERQLAKSVDTRVKLLVETCLRSGEACKLVYLRAQ